MEQYNAIFEWNMSPEEAQAFKLACTWEEQTKKMFPDMQGLSKLPRKGDPRKGSLFKECWKLMRLTRGLLRPDEYKLYIVANLQILRANKGQITPNTLNGDKAWIRWIVWKKLYDQKAKQIAGRQEPEERDANPIVVKELALTKKFLFEKCDGEPTAEKIQKFASGPQLRTWVNAGKISRYYVVLSPWVARTERQKLESKLQFDFDLFLGKANDDTRSHFRKEFAHEFDQ